MLKLNMHKLLLMFRLVLKKRQNVKDKLEVYRQRVANGEDFSTLAVLYSQDGSSRNGGELGIC